MTTIVDTKEWRMIRAFYGDRKAERSGVPLIDHIVEGCEALRKLQAPVTAIEAFAVHPLFQADDDFSKNCWDLFGLERTVILNVLEYRRAANAYLCKPLTDDWTLLDIKSQVGWVPDEVKLMLLADKWQNRKDFQRHHSNTHHRAKQLSAYFENWLMFLNEPKKLALLNCN